MTFTFKQPRALASSTALQSALEGINEACAFEDTAAGQKEAEKHNDGGEGTGLDVTKNDFDAKASEGGGGIPVGATGVGNEGFGGGMAGLGVSVLLGIITAPVRVLATPVFVAAGGAVAGAVSAKRKEIEEISKQIKAIATTEGQKAVKDGKITRESYKKKITDASWEDIAYGCVLGGLFSGIYGYIKGSQLQDLEKTLKAKVTELDTILKVAETAGVKNLKVGNEDGNPDFVPETGSEGTDPAAVEAPVPTGDAAAAAASAAPAAAGAAPAVPEGTAVNVAPAGDPVGQQDAGVGEVEGTPSTNAEGDATGAAPADASSDPAAVPAADNTAGTDANLAASGAAAAATDTAAATAADVAEAQGIQDDLASADKVGVAMESWGREMTQLGKAAAGLESLAAIMRSSKQVGGLDPHGAMAVTVGLETICDMLKIKAPLNVGLEAMEEKSDRIDGAETQAKSTQGLARRMYEAMKAGLAKFGAWLKNLWGLVTSAAKRAHARAKALEGTLATATFKTDAVKGGPAAAVVDTAEFVRSMSGAVQVVQNLNNPATYNSYVGLMESASALKFGSDENTVQTALSSFVEKLGAVRNEMGKDMTSSEKDGAIVLTKPWVGKQVLTIVVPTVAEKIGDFQTTIAAAGEQPKVEEVKAVTAQEAAALLKAVIAGLDLIINNTDETGLKGVDAKLNEVSNRIQNLGEPKAESDSKIMKFLSGLTASRSKLPVYAINRAFVGATTNAVSLISASMQAKQPEAAPAAGGAVSTTGAAPAV